MKRAVAYVRTSTDLQRYSLENQLVAIEAFCTVAQFELIRVYADVGKTGVTVTDRPELRALLADATRVPRPFDAVIVFDVSRWGRFQDVDEGAFYEHGLRLAGAPVLYCAEVFDNDDSPASTILKAMRRAMAAEYSRDLSVRISRGARRAAQRGFWCGGVPPFGYRRAIFNDAGEFVCEATTGQRKFLSDQHTMLVLGPPEEVASVRHIYRLFGEERHTVAAIVNRLTKEGRPTARGGPWVRDVVSRILTNEQYVGTAIFGKTEGLLSSRRTRKPKNTWIKVPRAHPPIISQAQFRRVQGRFHRRRIFTVPEIVRALRAIHEADGVITHAAIAACDDLPSVATLHRHFGSMGAAYDAAGVPHPPIGNKGKQARQCGA